MRALIFAALAVSCAAKEPIDSGDAPPIGSGGDDSGACEGTDPEARALSLSNGGVGDFEGELFPTLLVEIDAFDADGNLNSVTMEMWWEPAGDGEVNTSGDSDSRVTWTPSDSPCELTETTLGVRIQVGQGLQYNTLYDVAARFTDASGEVSGVVTATGSTPMANGDDGDGAGP